MCVIYYELAFQLTRSRGAWQSNINNKQIYKNFNSHAHVERDINNLLTIRKLCLISTHTLTWSVTNSPLQKIAVLRISTHTLTWSVTVYSITFDVSVCISTHTLTWSVTCGAIPDRHACRISTHTLTWSVTLTNNGFNRQSYDFNSHAHVERDPWRVHGVQR